MPEGSLSSVHIGVVRGLIVGQRGPDASAIAPDGLLRLDNIIADGISHQFADGMAVQPPHDIRAMRFSGLHTQTQSHCHFLAAFSFRE